MNSDKTLAQLRVDIETEVREQIAAEIEAEADPGKPNVSRTIRMCAEIARRGPAPTAADPYAAIVGDDDCDTSVAPSRHAHGTSAVVSALVSLSLAEKDRADRYAPMKP